MARLNIDETIFSGTIIRQLEGELGWNECEILGSCGFLWHDAQVGLNYCGTKEDILTWSRVRFTRPKDSEKFIQALIKVGLLEQMDEDFFYICGSHDQINGLRAKTGLGKKSFNSTDKRKSSPRGEEIPSPPDVNQENRDDKGGEDEQIESLPAMQGNSMQGKAGLGKARKGKSVRGKDISIGSEKSNPLPVARAQGTKNKSKVPAIWQARINDDDRAIAKDWFEYANQVTPKNSYMIEKFEEAICRIRVTHGYTTTHIRQLFEFIKQDEFWQGKAVSPPALLKPSRSDPGIIKLEQVVRSLKHRPKTKMEKLEEDLARQVREGGSSSLEYFLGIEPLKNVTEASCEPT